MGLTVESDFYEFNEIVLLYFTVQFYKHVPAVHAGLLIPKCLYHRLPYTPFTRYNRFDNRLYRVYKHLPGCQTGLTTGRVV